MNKVTHISLSGSLLSTSLILPTSAMAGALDKLEAQCLCFTEQASLAQMVSLGIMLTLIAAIFVVKWVHRKKPDQPHKSLEDSPAIQTLKQLKIGERFSDWSQLHRLTGHKQPTP